MHDGTKTDLQVRRPYGRMGMGVLATEGQLRQCTRTFRVKQSRVLTHTEFQRTQPDPRKNKQDAPRVEATGGHTGTRRQHVEKEKRSSLLFFVCVVYVPKFDSSASGRLVLWFPFA